MSLPQTECAVPPGEHASVNVSPSLPLSEVAFASQVVGFPSPAEDAGEDGPVFELSVAVLVWPPPPLPAALLSFFGFEQPARKIAASKSTTVMIRRNCVDWYDGVTVTAPFGLASQLIEGM